ncbi:RagB/SusD family nutrient uptake outer membrane protein [Arenibacter sp. F26102]|uniref:RagB/SusD family nutrient uptake outer membrane protein n=1 Tax=Arenibacter sp. F26102 TaxID=2926416 RepID=UPI001FF17B07|nr:RagB/SusD family nutrient uptake outer membrane protein [Arenibacter sp. F26102]MCK0144328.1 RagB/SusD family nutrient uptake outer membrane protein [Arenibacter sp. F26102]
MKKYIITTRSFLTYILIFSFFGCDNFLETEPRSFINPSTFFNTESDAEAAVLGGYRTFGSGISGSFGWHQDFQLAAMSDDFTVRPLANPNDVDRNAKFIDFNPTRGPQNLYYQVGAINTFSWSIDGISGMPEFPNKQALIAESKFLRAYNYFIMVQLFGGVSIIDKALETPEEASNIPRGTVDEVYDLIVSDLITGSEELPETSPQPGRPSKYTAMALLAKVYLTKGEWTDAASWAKRVINESDRELLPSIWHVFDDSNENNQESLFEIQYEIELQRANQVGNWPRGIGANADKDYFLGPNWGGVYIASEDLISDFEQGDERRNMIATEVPNAAGEVLTFNADGATPNYSIKRTPSAYINGLESNNNSSYNFIALRLADVYLIAAEAENEVNGPGSALQYINPVRNRAGLSNIEVTNPVVSSDKSAFRSAVRKERRTELFDERVRYFDLLRWGTLVERVLAVTPDAQIQPHHVLFPIPQDVFERNDGVNAATDQNPGY